MSRKIKLFAVVAAENPQVFLTVTATKIQAYEYANILLKQMHLNHFSMWCECHNEDIKSFVSWEKYSKACLTPEDFSQLSIVKIVYTNTNLAAILRMFACCLPLGASFDVGEEYNQMYIKYSSGMLSPEIQEELKLNKSINPNQINIDSIKTKESPDVNESR